jgi:prepilin-type N-terminal cleavage/methylation domain-containing protein
MRYFPLRLKENRKSFGGFTEKIRTQKALSLIEVMVALVLSSLLIGVISINFPMLKKTSDRFIQQTLFLKQYYIFLFILEDDYQRAELINLDDLSKLDRLNFRVDANLDGDYLDSSENITYRWNKSARRIDRKSGKSKYQSLLEGIEKFTWERTNSQPVCHRLYISDAYSKRAKLTRFCRYESM